MKGWKCSEREDAPRSERGRLTYDSRHFRNREPSDAVAVEVWDFCLGVG